MKAFRIFILIAVLVPALVLIRGMYKASQHVDDDPMTESDPERLAHRDSVYEKCLKGSSAAPDELYCKIMADKTIAYYTNTGMLQEWAYHGTSGLVPRFYHTPTPLEEMEARVEAASLASRNGADGSERFTGAKLAEYEAELEKLYGESDVFESKAQRCDPDGETMKAIMKVRPGESVEQLHRGMDCKDWDK